MAFLPVFTALVGIVDVRVLESSGEFNTGTARRMAADVAQIGALYYGNPMGNLTLLHLVLEVVTCLQLLNGNETPDTGDAFTAGALKFDNNGKNDVFGLLVRAYLDETRWSGDAAQAYSQGNKILMACINEGTAQMVAADNRMKEIVAAQAEDVATVGENLSRTRMVVVMAIVVAKYLLDEYYLALARGGLEALVEEEWRLNALRGFASLTATMAGGLALMLVYKLSDSASQYATDIATVIQHYADVGWVADGILPNPTGPKTVAAAPRVGGGVHSRDAGTTPRPPSRDEPTRWSDKAAKFSGPVSRSTNVAKQLPTPVPQLVSMAHRAAHTKKEAPAQKEAAAAPAVLRDLEGADTGVAAAPGVPIEVVTAGATVPAARPSPQIGSSR